MADVNNIQPTSPVPAVPSGDRSGNKKQRPREEDKEKPSGEPKPPRPEDPATGVDEYA